MNTGEVKFPFIARIINELGYEHFVVVYKIKNHKITIGDPAKPQIKRINEDLFIEQWQHQIITFAVTEDFEKKNNNKNSILKYFNYIEKQKN